jgi:hypothetical protein
MKVGDLVKPGKMHLLNNARIGIIISISSIQRHDLSVTALAEDCALVMWSEKPGIFTEQLSSERLILLERVII